MKKILTVAALLFMVIFTFTACENFDFFDKVTGGEPHVHTYAEWETVQTPTCTENGTKVRYCTCGEKQSESIAATGHTPGEVVIENVVDATCYSEGSYDSVICCSVCNAEISKTTVTINKLAHTVVIDAAVDATCTTTGLTEGKHCSICSEVIAEQYVIKMLGHNYVDGICTECGDFKYSKGLYFVFNSDGASLTVIGKGTCTDTDIIIPSTYNGYPVTAIGEGAFYHCTSLTSVIIPDSVTTIGYWAFTDCYSLTSIEASKNNAVYSSINGNLYTKDGKTLIQYAIGKSDTSFTIPDGVTTIADFAFYNCENLTSVTIPDSVTTIGEEAFAYCDSLTDVYYGGSRSEWKNITIRAGNEKLTGANIHYAGVVESQGLEFELNSDGASYTVTGIGTCTDTDVVIPKKYNGCPVTAIGDSAFSICTSLTSVTLGNSVTTIGDYAFAYCDSLTSVTLGNSVTTIGEDVFHGCTSLTSIEASKNNAVYSSINGNLYTKDGKTLIQYAIGKSDTSFTIPDGVTTIASYAFYNCDSLTSLTIPDSVTTIGDYAFRGCYRLTSVTIPDSVTTIGSYAFSNCSSLTSVIIPDRVTKIGNSAFADCRSLRSVTIGNSVTTIGDYAFYDCDSLTSVTIPDSVTTIGYDAFVACTSLTSIEVSKNNAVYSSINGNLYTKDEKTLIQYAIGKRDTSFTVPDGVTAIGDEAFYDCDSLTSVIIPDRVTKIGNSAFADCRSLRSVTIPDSVTTIGNDAFDYCDSLEFNKYENACYLGNENNPYRVLIKAKDRSITDCTIHKDTKIICYHAFSYCDSLTSVTIPDSVTAIGDWAFSGCTSLTSIEVSENNIAYKSIDGNLYTKDGKTLVQYAIGKSDTSFTIPDSVTTIGDSAFSRCSSLTSVTIPDSVTTIGDYAFSYCDSLTSVTIGNSVTTIGEYAFRGCDSLTSVIFKDTTTWYRTSYYDDFINMTGGEFISVEDPSDNATYLKSYYYWYKK